MKAAIQEWKNKWVQGYTTYAESLKGKVMSSAVKAATDAYAGMYVNEIICKYALIIVCNNRTLGDDEGEEKVALSVLCALLAQKTTDTLTYIYEECPVSW